MKRTDEPSRCQCDFCRTHDRFIWATVMECRCGCHLNEDARPTGHEGLCCEYPNGRKIDNPYDDLLPAYKYNKILMLMDEEGNMPMSDMDGEKGRDVRDRIKILINEYKI